MKNHRRAALITLLTGIALWRLIAVIYAQTQQEAATPKADQKQAPAQPQQDKEEKPRVDFVRTASFHLKNGKSVSGKVLSEDQNKITIEELVGSRIVVSSYEKREIDGRTMRQTTVPGVRYYQELADYFESRTWDFKNDPEDFEQVIRSYERIKELIEESRGRIPQSTQDIDAKIAQLRKEKDRWVEKAESLAAMRKLEFEATFDSRLAELEEKINALGNELSKREDRLRELIKNANEKYAKLEADIAKMTGEVGGRLKELEAKIEANERDIDRLWRRYRDYPRYYYPLPRDDKKSPQ